MKKILSVLAVLGMLAGCTGTSVSYQPGTYEGSAEGRNGDVVVEVSVTENRIESVSVKSHQETDGIANAALEHIPEKIIEKQSTEVDAESGCTITSEAIMQAAAEALKKART